MDILIRANTWIYFHFELDICEIEILSKTELKMIRTDRNDPVLLTHFFKTVSAWPKLESKSRNQGYI